MSVREIPGVQKPVVRYAKSLGWLAWKMKIEGINGCPDYAFMRRGVIIWIEFKAPGEKPTAQQVLRHEELRAQGFDVHVIDNADAGRALFDSFEEDML